MSARPRDPERRVGDRNHASGGGRNEGGQAQHAGRSAIADGACGWHASRGGCTVWWAGMSRRSTPLHSAAESNDVAAVRAELAKGVSTEIRNAGFEETPLHKAAVKGNVAVAEELLRAGADIAAVRSGGFTPLHMSETVEIAKLLLDHGADKSAKASVSQAPRSSHLYVSVPLLCNAAESVASV